MLEARARPDRLHKEMEHQRTSSGIHSRQRLLQDRETVIGRGHQVVVQVLEKPQILQDAKSAAKSRIPNADCIVGSVRHYTLAVHLQETAFAFDGLLIRERLMLLYDVSCQYVFRKG